MEHKRRKVRKNQEKEETEKAETGKKRLQGQKRMKNRSDVRRNNRKTRWRVKQSRNEMREEQNKKRGRN